MKKNPHKVLGLPSDATQDDAKRAYKKLVKLYHPDSLSGMANSVRFREITDAYRDFEVDDGTSTPTLTISGRTIILPFSYMLQGGEFILNGQPVTLRSGLLTGDTLHFDDIYQVRVESHPIFRRSSRLDLETTITIPLVSYIIGDKISVPVPRDKTVILTIPPKTNFNSSFSISGHGVTYGGRTGNLIVKGRVSFPDVSPEDHTILKKILS